MTITKVMMAIRAITVINVTKTIRVIKVITAFNTIMIFTIIIKVLISKTASITTVKINNATKAMTRSANC